MDLSRFMHCVLEPFATPCRDMLSKTFKRNAFQETPNSVCVCARARLNLCPRHISVMKSTQFSSTCTCMNLRPLLNGLWNQQCLA